VVDQAKYCLMEIKMPADLAGAPGAKVEISGVGTYSNGAKVALPVSVTIQWRLWVNNKCSQWYDKNVDCNPLVVDQAKYCLMDIQMPADLAGAPGAKVEISGVGTYNNSATVVLPVSVTIQWRLWVNNKCSQWYPKTVDCNSLVVDQAKYCLMEIQMPADLAVAPGAKVEISGVGTYSNGATVVLPVCVTIQWRLWVNNKCSQWYTQHVDCKPLAVDTGKYCNMLIDITAGKAEISGVGTYSSGATVVLPVSVTIQWRLWTGNQAGPWQPKKVDCTSLLLTLP
jgi:hypothetical protein